MIGRLWRDHSLTVVVGGLGVGAVAVAWPLGEGRLFDAVLGFGHGLLTVALLNALAGRLRERNRPEE